jgi:hypothetical protein
VYQQVIKLYDEHAVALASWLSIAAKNVWRGARCCRQQQVHESGKGEL